MKKVFIILIACVSLSALSACNNDSSSTTDVKDSVMEKIDSTGDARVDSVQEATDSLQNKVKSTFEKTDSANKALSDSMAKAKKN
ncbi:MAG: hypothetical protein M3352_06975 [Bacteroidota bacterium]|nr:hypothetical protein [Bacteroidota bacterium]